jgi:hypothetical protein
LSLQGTKQSEANGLRIFINVFPAVHSNLCFFKEKKQRISIAIGAKGQKFFYIYLGLG